MPKFIIYQRYQQIKERLSRQGIKARSKINSRKYLLSLLCIISLTGFFHLVQINNLATKGYNIKDLEEKVATLKEKNKDLEIMVTDLRSSERINKEVENLDMEQVVRVEYLKANGASVAINR